MGSAATAKPGSCKGSVLIFKNGGDDGQLLNRLKQIESEGIGERRAEGFGRLAFNWHHQERIPVSYC